MLPDAPMASGDRPAVPIANELKASRTGPLIAFDTQRRPVWTPRDYASLAREGFMQNAIVYRCVRMLSECAATVPLLLYEGDIEIEQHPILDLVRRPNPFEAGADLFETFFGHLLVSGNAYLEAVNLDGEVRELHALRPDRIKVVPGPDGWPEAHDYTVAGRSVRISGEVAQGIRAIHHMRLYHPLHDHYGMSPMEAAATAIDLHNASAQWNKALLDNAARPSGALVYTARDGNLTTEQYERLKSELEQGFQGAANAGRPMLLEGGLDWKSMSLSPKDMDFIEARHVAAREIALAFGVPPMLLGIPGDNTYANMAEATRSFWRQTVIPLVERTANGLSMWLSPGYGGNVRLKPNLDNLPALASEREALWAMLEKTSFLTTDEKRAVAGYSPLPPDDPPTTKFNPHHDALGRFTTGTGGELIQPVAKKPPKGQQAKPAEAGKTPVDVPKPSETPATRTRRSDRSAAEAAKDIPSWARGEAPLIGENGNAFAKRLLDKKYGPIDHDRGPASEFNMLRKFGDRAFD